MGYVWLAFFAIATKQHIRNLPGYENTKIRLVVGFAVKMACDDSEVLGWASSQGHILTGGGRLEAHWPTYEDTELPHFHKLVRCLCCGFCRFFVVVFVVVFVLFCFVLFCVMMS